MRTHVQGHLCEYRFVPIIKAGTPLPVSRADSFFTMFNNQDAVDVNVFQGESEDARENILIVAFYGRGIVSGARQQRIRVSYESRPGRHLARHGH